MLAADDPLSTMSATTSTPKKPALAGIQDLLEPQPVSLEVQKKLSEISPEAWVQSLALMLAAGMSIGMASERLRIPLNTITAVMRMPEFDAMVRSMASEMKHDVTADLIAGAGPDNVLFLIKVRMDEKVDIKHRIRCSEILLKARMDNKLIAELSGRKSSLGELIDKHGSIDKGAEAQLNRYFDNNPGLLRMLQQDPTAGAPVKQLVPETGQASDQPASDGLPG